MQQNAVIVKNLWIFLVVALLLCFGCLGVIWVFSANIPSGNGNTGGSKSSSSALSGASSTSSAPPFVITREFKFAGIKEDGTIVLFSGEELEFTIELDDMGWRDLQFSPDGVYVSGLAKQAAQSKHDIYLYKISTASWEKITPYASTDSGVEAHLWASKDKILFLQGQGSQRWLHSYDLANRQIAKLFPTSDEVVALQGENIVMVDDLARPNFVRARRLSDGEQLWQLSLSQLQVLAPEIRSLERVLVKRDQVVLTALNDSGSYNFVTFDGTTPRIQLAAEVQTETSQSSESISSTAESSSASAQSASPNYTNALQLICVVENGLWGWDKTMPELLSIVEFDLPNLSQQLLYTQLVSTGSKLDLSSVRCTDTKILFKLDRSGSQSAWYLVSKAGGSAVKTSSVFKELIVGN